MTDIPFIDFHTHHQSNKPGILEVVSMHGAVKSQMAFFSLGFHPWMIDRRLSVEQLLLLETSYLHDSRCLAIGEFGLDALKGPNMNLQEEVFIQQVEIANRLNAPVILHCVRAFDRLLRMRRLYGNTPWAVHGFVRNKTLARQLLDAGILLSVAPFKDINESFLTTLQYLPVHSVFLETDGDLQADIEERYRFFSSLRNLPLDDIKIQIFDNFKLFFKNKWKYQTG